MTWIKICYVITKQTSSISAVTGNMFDGMVSIPVMDRNLPLRTRPHRLWAQTIVCSYPGLCPDINAAGVYS
jgi:hypothetical protein